MPLRSPFVTLVAFFLASVILPVYHQITPDKSIDMEERRSCQKLEPKIKLKATKLMLNIVWIAVSIKSSVSIKKLKCFIFCRKCELSYEPLTGL